MEFFHRPEDPNIGYWGPRTSAVDWCEPNYTYSFYIAEFFNTITSLPAAFFALRGLYLTYKYGYDKRFFVINMLVGLVGIGSAMFHGTLLYTGQIMDELPMVYTSLALLYAVLEMDSSAKSPTYKYLSPILILYGVLFTCVYLYLPTFFIFFLIGYILAILLLIYQSALIYKRPTTLTHQRTFIVLAVGFYVGGWLGFWVPEILFCDTIQFLNFHSLWHVTSTLGAFVMIVFLTFQREMQLGKKPQLNYNTFLGIKLIPYVHVPSSIIIKNPSTKDINNKDDNDDDNNVHNAVQYVLKKRSIVQ